MLCCLGIDIKAEERLILIAQTLLWYQLFLHLLTLAPCQEPDRFLLPQVNGTRYPLPTAFLDRLEEFIDPQPDND